MRSMDVQWQKPKCCLSTRKTLVFILVICFLIAFTYFARGKISGSEDGAKCKKLFGTGSVIWNNDESTAFWQPNDCNLRYRTPNESLQCMEDFSKKKKRAPFILLIGDSRIRQLRDGLIELYTGVDFDYTSNRLAKNRDDPNYKKHASSEDDLQTAGLHLKFEWHAWMDDKLTQSINKLIQDEHKPDVVVIGFGAWEIRQCARDKKTPISCLPAYQRSFITLLPLLQTLAAYTDIIWLPQGTIHFEQLFKHNPRDPGNTAGLIADSMILYNNAIKEILESPQHKDQPPIIFWESAWELSFKLNDNLDGLHYGMLAKHQLLQIIIDYLCAPVTQQMESSILHAWRNNRLNYCCS